MISDWIYGKVHDQIIIRTIQINFVILNLPCIYRCSIQSIKDSCQVVPGNITILAHKHWFFYIINKGNYQHWMTSVYMLLINIFIWYCAETPETAQSSGLQLVPPKPDFIVVSDSKWTFNVLYKLSYCIYVCYWHVLSYRIWIWSWPGFKCN